MGCPTYYWSHHNMTVTTPTVAKKFKMKNPREIQSPTLVFKRHCTSVQTLTALTQASSDRWRLMNWTSFLYYRCLNFHLNLCYGHAKPLSTSKMTLICHDRKGRKCPVYLPKIHKVTHPELNSTTIYLLNEPN